MNYVALRDALLSVGVIDYLTYSSLLILAVTTLWFLVDRCIKYRQLSRAHAAENAQGMSHRHQEYIADDESALMIWKAGQSKCLPGGDNHYGQMEREL